MNMNMNMNRKRDGFPLMSGPQSATFPPVKFEAKLNKNMVKHYEDMLLNIHSKQALVINWLNILAVVSCLILILI